MGKKTYGRSSNDSSNRGYTKPKSGYRAPTPGYQDAVFTMASVDNTDAKTFNDVLSKLVRMVGSTNLLENGRSVASRAIENLEEPTLTEPPALVKRGDDEDEFAWKRRNVEYDRKLDKHLAAVDDWAENRGAIYLKVLEHCTKELQDRLRQIAGYEKVNNERDAIGLLILIRGIAQKHDNTMYPTMSYVMSDMMWLTTVQEKNQSLEDFLGVFKSTGKTIDATGGCAGYHPALYKKHLDVLWDAADLDEEKAKQPSAAKLVKDSATAAMALCKDEYQACLLLLVADKDRYGQILTDMHNKYITSGGEAVTYPTTLQGALNILKSYKRNGDKKEAAAPAESAGVAFVQPGKKDASELDCFGCGKKGHMLVDCDQLSDADKKEIMKKKRAEWRDRLTERGVSNLNIDDPAVAEKMMEAYAMMQGLGFVSVATDATPAELAAVRQVDLPANFLAPKSYSDIVRGTSLLNPGEKRVSFSADTKGRDTLDWWKLYLDSCATFHTSFVRDMLSDVYKSKVTLHGSFNAGTTISSEKGYLGPFDLWLNEKGIANLLSIPQLEEEGYKVQYETDLTQWTVTTPQGKKIVFEQDSGLCNRMPYIDMREQFRT